MMSFSLVLDLLGVGVIFWAIGRMFLHLALLDLDKAHITRKSRIFYVLAWIFYILGNLSSLIIGAIDGMCHKRLYHNHLAELRELRSFVPHTIPKREEFDRFCADHEVGPLDGQAPIDIPVSWYALR